VTRTIAAVSALCATALVGVAPTATAATTPKLRLVWTQPLVVRGESFKPRERVVLTALTPSGSKRVVVRASARGRLGATFRLPSQPCGRAFAIRAIGGSGSRAVLAVPSTPCVPPPIRVPPPIS
jgi:hypothetical protein